MIGAANLDTVKAQFVVPLVAALSSGAGSSLTVRGPEFVVIAGVTVPLFSAVTGVVGVGLGLWLAPSRAVALGGGRLIGLTLALIAIILCSVITTGQQPLVAISWGIGLGFSGLPVAETLGAQAKAGVKALIDVSIAIAAAKAGVRKTKETDDV
ncbi:MAG: hypothetical protein EOP62_14275 [Sphingomonadales bacterium]|nr:MAG: hypothetical protein EOP62_14275 [Sphingomonadales bacterium]